MQGKKEIFYIAELNLPSKSAYSIHVMKMCEAFSKLKHNISLIVINSKNVNQINKIYNINHKFNILSVFNNYLLGNSLDTFFGSSSVSSHAYLLLHKVA